MPQLDFFLSESERNAFVEFSFKNNFSIVPDINYDSNKYYIASSMSDYKVYCEESPLLFLINKEYSLFSLEMRPTEKCGEQAYYINQRCGGPTIDFYSPIVGEKQSKIVGPGFIGVYPFYYRGNEKFVPNKELSNRYKLLTTFIRNRSTKVQLTQRTYWIGNETIENAKKGVFKLLPISGIDLLELIN